MLFMAGSLDLAERVVRVWAGQTAVETEGEMVGETVGERGGHRVRERVGERGGGVSPARAADALHTVVPRRADRASSDRAERVPWRARI